MRPSCQLGSAAALHWAVGEVTCLLFIHYRFIQHLLCARHCARDVKRNLALKTPKEKCMEWDDKYCR